jgi:cytochrome P450
LKHIPGEYGLPYIGKAIQFLDDLYGAIDHQYKNYGPVSRIRMGGQEGLLVVGPDLLQSVYLDKDKNISAKMGYDQNLGNFYPDTILLSDFDNHRPLRRMFQNAFKNATMRTYTEMMNKIMAENIDQIDNMDSFVFFPMIKKTLLDVANKVFIGVESGPESDKLADAFVDASEGLLGLIKKEWPGTKYKKGQDGIRYLREYFGSMIAERRTNDGSDTFSIICKETDEDGNLFSDEAIINQMTFLLFAAHDTTTSALSQMMYYSAKHPEWKERMVTEVKALNKDQLDYDDLAAMADTDLVFHEALRLHPSVPMMTRRTIRECEMGGYRVPANTILFIAPTYNHHMAEFWTNPNTFDPERFTPERNEHKGHAFQYMPFGGGAHKCIGMHFANMVAKTFMFQFVQKFDYSIEAGYAPKIVDFPLPRPQDGLKLKLKKI